MPAILASGENVYETLGPGFTLLASGADAIAAVPALQRTADTRDIPLTVVADREGSLREIYEAELVLVRPDQFVAWAGSAAEIQGRQILSRVAGREAVE